MRNTRGKRGGSALLAGLAVAWLGLSGTAEAGEASAVYFGVDESTDAAMAVAQRLARLTPPVTLDGTPLHLSRIAEIDGFATAGGGPERCAGPAADADTFRAGLDDLVEAMLDMDLERTGALEEKLDRQWACLTEPVLDADLARFNFLQGILGYEASRPDVAHDAFSRTLALVPDYPWDEDYPPSAREAFDQASETVGRAVATPLAVVVAPGMEVRVDGRREDAGHPISLLPGRHLIQVRDPSSATWDALGLFVRDERAVTLLHGSALESLVATVDAPPEEEQLHRVLTALQTIGEVALPDYLVWLGEPALGWRWDGAAAEMAAVDLPPPADQVPVPTRLKPGKALPVMLAAGGAMLAAGGVWLAVAQPRLAEYNTCVNDAVAGSYCQPFPSSAEVDNGTYRDDPDKLANYQEWQKRSRSVNGSVALLIAGGTVAALSVPVGLGTGKRVPVEQVTVSLGWQPALDGSAGIDRGTFVIGIRLH